MFVSNAHVLTSGLGSAMGRPHLRGPDGTTCPVDQALRFSLHEDYVVFRARGARAPAALVPGEVPDVGAPVYAVGNALGEGVVLRDGLLTSLTPEDQDGRWKWLRFSAATSPGNSGGPLLDQEGRVVGVVSARSPGENLNYALPIAQVQQGSEREGVYDLRSSFGVPILRQQMVTGLKGSMKLPLPWEQFTQRMLELHERHHLDNQAKLLREHAADLPPGGKSGRLLSTLDRFTRFALIGQKSDGSWGLIEMENVDEVELGDGESIRAGVLAGAGGFHWVREDRGGDALPVRDGKAFMDGLPQAARQAQRRARLPAGSAPAVVEADAHAHVPAGVGRDLVPEPALEQQQRARLRRHHDPRTVALVRIRLARWRAHVAVEARVLELQAGCTARHAHVVRAADGGERMQVQAVVDARRHHVDPAVRHHQRRVAEVEFQLRGIALHMPVDDPAQGVEGGGDLVHAAGRGIGGEPAGVVAAGPFLARRVVMRELQALAQQPRVQRGGACTGQRRRVDARGKEAVDRQGARSPRPFPTGAGRPRPRAAGPPVPPRRCRRRRHPCRHPAVPAAWRRDHRRAGRRRSRHPGSRQSRAAGCP